MKNEKLAYLKKIYTQEFFLLLFKINYNSFIDWFVCMHFFRYLYLRDHFCFLVILTPTGKRLI